MKDHGKLTTKKVIEDFKDTNLSEEEAEKGSSKKVGELRSLFNFVQHYYFGQLNIIFYTTSRVN